MRGVVGYIFRLVVLLSIVGCTSQGGADIDTTDGRVMELSAPLPRTINSGDYTLWSEGDTINVFHAESGCDEYVSDGAFSMVDLATSLFRGSLGDGGSLLVGKSYDWYACYPFRAALQSPRSDGYNFTIGCPSTSYQTQFGNGSSEHLAGENMPLIGGAKRVESGVKPQLAMKNAASLIEFSIDNSTATDFIVKNIEFSAAGKALVGAFAIDFSDFTSVVYTPCQGEISDTAKLRVEGGEVISKGSHASFYIAVAPFIAECGSQLDVRLTLQKISGEEFSLSKRHILSSDTPFEAGHSKRLELRCDAEDEVELKVVVPSFVEEIVPSAIHCRAMTYNVHTCRGTDNKVDYQRIADVINRADVEVVALQELDSMTTRYPNQHQLQNLADLTDMHATFGAAINRGVGKYGVGVLTKEKPLSHYRVPLPCSSEPRVLLVVEMEDYYFCCTHFSLIEEYRTKAVEIIIEEAKKLDKPMVVAGDLNAVRNSTPLRLLQSSFYLLGNGLGSNSFPSSNPVKEIDFVSVYKDDGDVVVKLNSHSVLDVPIVSDHLPVVVDVLIGVGSILL